MKCVRDVFHFSNHYSWTKPTSSLDALREMFSCRNNFEMVEENAFLGSGGFGRVFKVRQSGIDRALKIVLTTTQYKLNKLLPFVKMNMKY